MVKFNKNYYICFGFTIIIIQQNAQIHDIVICQFHRITAHHPVDSASKKVDLWIEIMTIIRYAWCEQKIGAKTMWAGAFELWNKNEKNRILNEKPNMNGNNCTEIDLSSKCKITVNGTNQNDRCEKPKKNGLPRVLF